MRSLPGGNAERTKPSIHVRFYFLGVELGMLSLPNGDTNKKAK